ncbi:hypothetical protein HA402_010722 [Bradysia odoriphaga]|nr:hypothetical protein HA402_010722 [Bradysia odoriphaga]
MENTRRSQRTPKPKGDYSVKQKGKNVCKSTTNGPTAENATICKKQATRKSRKLGTFTIDCSVINGENRIELEDFKSYLQGKIKVGRKRNDKRVKVEKEDEKILIHADVFIEKKYIKYLTKLFLKERKLNNFIRVVNGKRSYSLNYFRKESQ